MQISKYAYMYIGGRCLFPTFYLMTNNVLNVLNYHILQLKT